MDVPVLANQLCTDIGGRLEDLPGTMDDRQMVKENLMI